MLVDGDMILKNQGHNYTIMGYLIAYNLGIRLYDLSNPILVYAPKRTKKSLTTLNQSFNTGSLMASAVFSVQQAKLSFGGNRFPEEPRFQQTIF